MKYFIPVYGYWLLLCEYDHNPHMLVTFWKSKTLIFYILTTVYYNLALYLVGLL